MSDIAVRPRQTNTSIGDTTTATVELPRYFAVSAAALAVDAGGLWLLYELVGLHFMAANAVSFLLGSIVAYLGSIFWVFRSRRINGPAVEFALFVAIGLGGLLVNEAMLWAGVVLAGSGLAAAKVAAAGSSFAFNFVVRKYLLFN